MRTEQTTCVEHGGPQLEELCRLGIHPSTLLDFSVCTNPFGPSPRVAEALARVSLEQYPDREATATRAALAEKHDLSPRRILMGNGASELIWLAALAFVKPQDRVLVVGPTYGEYARSAALQGGTVNFRDASKERSFVPPTRAIEDALDRERPKVIFLCNPNNPTGSILDPAAILSWVRQYPRTLFVVDEAYQAFVMDLESLMGKSEENLLVLRSMTKDYALAGLRIGYAVGTETLVAELRRAQPPWSVNGMAQAAALATLGDEEHLRESLRRLRHATQELRERLTDLGLEVYPSSTHFFLVRAGNATSFRLRLLKRGILVRDASSFGLPAFVRIATRQPQDNARLLSVLREGV